MSADCPFIDAVRRTDIASLPRLNPVLRNIDDDYAPIIQRAGKELHPVSAFTGTKTRILAESDLLMSRV